MHESPPQVTSTLIFNLSHNSVICGSMKASMIRLSQTVGLSVENDSCYNPECLGLLLDNIGKLFIFLSHHSLILKKRITIVPISQGHVEEWMAS